MEVFLFCSTCERQKPDLRWSSELSSNNNQAVCDSYGEDLQTRRNPRVSRHIETNLFVEATLGVKPDVCSDDPSKTVSALVVDRKHEQGGGCWSAGRCETPHGL